LVAEQVVRFELALWETSRPTAAGIPVVGVRNHDPNSNPAHLLVMVADFGRWWRGEMTGEALVPNSIAKQCILYAQVSTKPA
jgi:hypothetical protein